MPSFEIITERDFRKQIQSTETYTNDAAVRICFSENALGDGPVFWIIFEDSWIRVNLSF